MPSVLLTGANGFVAVAVLQALLEQGYDVVGTVRSESKSRFLRDKFGDDGKLKFAVVQDITVPGAFDEVLKAHKFDAVVHTSSPYHLSVTDPKKDMLDPAIKGTTGILESVSKLAPTVKRVVITATFGNMLNIPKGAWPGKVYTEEDWSPVTLDEQTLSHPLMAYVAGKLCAERAAWDFVKEQKPHFTITTLCPPNVLGPPEQELTSLKFLNTSNTDIYDVFNGVSEPRYTTWAWIDVRDLAQAHVRAIDAPAAANQRYLVSPGNYSAQAIADYIWKHYPERAAAKGVKKGNPGKLYPDTGVFKVDNSKSIRDLGMTYKYDFDTMLRDTLKKSEELEAEGK
ncbi:methylglyoxal reductase (NADPH-dependent) gre2 [Tulasnella sp. 424]|nr:methylglyoxal reductase (NADPH-dependent) gre2 [Tulasnella sp. 424]KAG8969611.1 methylglyoxal reductase (NADPH-dependent) gre2 [Tulasnella sp. 425]